MKIFDWLSSTDTFSSDSSDFQHQNAAHFHRLSQHEPWWWWASRSECEHTCSLQVTPHTRCKVTGGPLSAAQSFSDEVVFAARLSRFIWTDRSASRVFLYVEPAQWATAAFRCPEEQVSRTNFIDVSKSRRDGSQSTSKMCLKGHISITIRFKQHQSEQ